MDNKISDLETSSRILQKSGNKKIMSFWRKLVIGNLACIKTRYNFKPNLFNDQKHRFQDRNALKSPWLMPQGTFTKNYPFLGNTFEPGQKWYEQLQTKSQPSQNNSHIRMMLQLGRPSTTCIVARSRQIVRVKKKNKRMKNWLSCHALENFD